MEHNIDQATKNYTIFCDLDGTLWEQGDPTEIAKPGYQPKLKLGALLATPPHKPEGGVQFFMKIGISLKTSPINWP